MSRARLKDVKVLEAGHTYRVRHRRGVGSSVIEFARDELPGQPNAREGILCQSLLRVLIDRVNFLNAQAPCHENVEILRALREAIVAFESRALRRKLERHPNLEHVGTGEDGHVFVLRKTRKR